jgi:hypothetical protein
MWQLKMRDTNKDWIDLGMCDGIGPAGSRILELEGDPNAALFFRVYADPPMGKSDAEILSRLEYQGGKGFYVLTRRLAN